jgi:hypothetical protein
MFVLLPYCRDSTAFVQYHAEMPWLAIPFEKAKTIGRSLGSKYGIQGYPTLILCDATGKVLTNDGRGQVAIGPKSYPFANIVDKPTSMLSALPQIIFVLLVLYWWFFGSTNNK